MRWYVLFYVIIECHVLFTWAKSVLASILLSNFFIQLPITYYLLCWIVCTLAFIYHATMSDTINRWKLNFLFENCFVICHASSVKQLCYPANENDLVSKEWYKHTVHCLWVNYLSHCFYLYIILSLLNSVWRCNKYINEFSAVHITISWSFYVIQ